jgi:hypothetical protein
MKLHPGKIYLLENELWQTKNLKKIGVAKDTEKRKVSLETALPDPINILYESEILQDKFFYEYLLSKLLFKYRYKSNREFYQIDTNDFVSITNTIETINKLYNSPELLLEFIYNYDTEYYNQRFGKKILIENKKKNYSYSFTKKKKQKIFIDTSSLYKNQTIEVFQ